MSLWRCRDRNDFGQATSRYGSEAFQKRDCSTVQAACALRPIILQSTHTSTRTRPFRTGLSTPRANHTAGTSSALHLVCSPRQMGQALLGVQHHATHSSTNHVPEFPDVASRRHSLALAVVPCPSANNSGRSVSTQGCRVCASSSCSCHLFGSAPIIG